MLNSNPFYNAYNPKLLRFEHAWVRFIKNGELNYSVIKKEIADSWQRCKHMKIDPLMADRPVLIDENRLRAKIKSHQQLINIAWPFMKSLYELVKGSGFRVDIVDSEGYILKSIGDEDILNLCHKTNSFPGANRSERISGTTAIGLVILHKKPFQVAGAEHYIQLFQRWTCSAAPILGADGEILGILSISGKFELVHQHTLGMVVATAKAIENEMQLQQINKQLNQNNSQLKATLRAVSDGVIYANSEGIITQLNFEMEKLLGIDASKIIGKKAIYTIHTSPALNTVLNSVDMLNHYDIILHGENSSYNCFLNTTLIYDEEKKVNGMVLIFRKIEEIEKLANRINKNTAYFTFDDIIGQSQKFQQTITLAKKAASMNFRVIIEGESGTGKEMFAQAIHNSSSRQHKPFIAVDCGAIPRELLESELFGYESGAFTGARKGGKPGKFELANGGTLFLDEIGNMPMEMQIKILRVLQENQIVRIGGCNAIPVDVRIIAATNADLKAEVEKNNFREDLYYRLNVFHIKIPPLRERKEDIPILIQHFLQSSSFINKKIDSKAITMLQNYDWPGNVRQLHNVIERSMVMSKENIITPKDLPPEIVRKYINPDKIHESKLASLQEAIEKYVLNVLSMTNGNVSKAAKILKISRTTIYKILKDVESAHG